MKTVENIWGINEYVGDGKTCPIVPAQLPWYKKLLLTFFRFGICPMCITLSLIYSVFKTFRKLAGRS